MVMVMKSGRLDAATLANYELFVKHMTSNSVPLTIVVTHCERQPGGMQSWVVENAHTFQALQYDSLVATTFITPDAELDNVPAMLAKVHESKEKSWEQLRNQQHLSVWTS
jgi:hypothetical protein